MTLYKNLKQYLPKSKAYLSDNEFLLLNRRDYNINEVSPVQATLVALKAPNVSYPYRVLMGFLDSIADAKKREDFNIILTDPSVAIAAFHTWVRSGGAKTKGKVYAPKGFPQFGDATGIMKHIIDDFLENTDQSPSASPTLDRFEKHFTYVLGNTKTANQTSFAVQQFIKVKSGLLLLKDYARVDAFPERDLLESNLLFPNVTFEGHGYILRM